MEEVNSYIEVYVKVDKEFKILWVRWNLMLLSENYIF